MCPAKGTYTEDDVHPAKRRYGISKDVEVNCLIRRGRFPKLATILCERYHITREVVVRAITESADTPRSDLNFWVCYTAVTVMQQRMEKTVQ